MKNSTIAIPKGRLFNYVNKLFVNRTGVDISLKDKQYLKEDVFGGLNLFFAKPKSIPQLIHSRFIEFGFCGRDIMENSGYNMDNIDLLYDTGLDKVNICLCSHLSKDELFHKNGPVIVATEYENIADDYFTKLGIPHYILNTSGSTEGYVHIGADCVIDCVETGETLADNGLKVIDVIMESTLCLYMNSEFCDALLPYVIYNLIDKPDMFTVEVEGNDGTGKSTVCKQLLEKCKNIIVEDRGILTKLTDLKDLSLLDKDIFKVKNKTYVILDCPVSVSSERIYERDGDKALLDLYHTPEMLEKYRERYLNLAKILDIPVISTEHGINVDAIFKFNNIN